MPIPGLNAETTQFVSRPYIVPVAEYENPSTRIELFKELNSLNLTAPTPMLILGHEAFKEYIDHGGLTPALQQSIGNAFDNIRLANPTRGAYIGRAFFVPGIEKPNGPRTAAIYDKTEYLKTVEKFYQFVIEQGYDKPEAADIALILHPFINVMDRRPFYGGIEISEKELLPWTGGYVIPDPIPGHERRIKIVATFGADEAVQSCPSDEFVVDPDRNTVMHKIIALKDISLVPQSGDRYVKFDIPQRFQREQALTDAEALLVAEAVQKVFIKRPDSRVEFILQSDGIYIREIDSWLPTRERDLFLLPKGESITAPIVRVESIEDTKKIRTDKSAIVYFGPGAFQRRTTDVFTQVAHTERTAPLIALVHGTIITSHMAKILHEAGHSIIHVGNETYETDEKIRVGRKPDGSPYMEFVDPYARAVIHFTDVDHLQHGEAGQKVRRLALMRHYDIPTPDGFAISSSSIWQWLKDIGVSADVARLDSIDLNDDNSLEVYARGIQHAIQHNPIPRSLRKHIDEAVRSYGFPCYAIRSSGNEDGETRSLAGLYESHVDVSPRDISRKVKGTVASYFSPQSIKAVRRLSIPAARMTIGVGIQEYIPKTDRTIGFVIFTGKEIIHVDAVKGSPESLLSGTATDYLQIEMTRRNHRVTIIPKGKPGFNFTSEQQQALLPYVFTIEEIFDGFQDIEGIIDPKRGSIFVQARPL